MEVHIDKVGDSVDSVAVEGKCHKLDGLETKCDIRDMRQDIKELLERQDQRARSRSTSLDLDP